MAKIQNVVLEDVRIVFRNFSGEEGQFNRKGDRNFAALLPDSVAKQMEKDGWNIKYLKPREEEDQPQAYIKVKVNYSGRPPKIMMVTSRGKTALDESVVGVLDYADIKLVDLNISPYEWTVSGNTGVTAYLQSIFVTIVEDELDRKYQDVPDSAISARVDRQMELEEHEILDEDSDDQKSLGRGF